MTTEFATVRSTKSRSFFLGLITVSVTVIGCLLVLEVALHFLPVASGLRTQPVNENNPVLRFEPNRDFIFSRDWNFSNVNHGHINNDGFINDYDYHIIDTPLLAVVGDSYIEAAMVPFGQTLHGRLHEKIKGRGRIYSFGTSGAPLSQYLAWTAYVRDRYNPSGLLINVVGNDFDESLRKYKPAGFLTYVPDEDGVLMLQQAKGGKRSRFREIVTHSALARYLFFNVGVSKVVNNLNLAVRRSSNQGEWQFFGNTTAEASEERIFDSKSAVLAFFRDLPSYAGLPSHRILFVVDGMRAATYEPELLPSAEQSYFGQMRRFLINTAREKGYEVIDLHDLFVERHNIDKVRFEFPTDGHWNAVGHEVAAQAVEGSDLFRDLFER